jgi:hypothetical protein
VDAHFVIFPFVDGFCGFIVEDVKPSFNVESEDVYLIKIRVILLLLLQTAARGSSICLKRLDEG